MTLYILTVYELFDDGDVVLHERTLKTFDELVKCVSDLCPGTTYSYKEVRVVNQSITVVKG